MLFLKSRKPTSLPGNVRVPVPVYRKAPELAVITTYFNPCGYKRRRYNHDVFVATMRRSGIMCITIECAFNDGPFELEPSLDVIRVRGDNLWQKERLLNIAAASLPSSISAVAWLDCDILFQNANWACDTVRLLKKHAVVQTFEKCILMEDDGTYNDSSKEFTSFGVIAPSDQRLITCGRYDRHGHTGYGWAMRREIFDKAGLYEHAITGSADHYMAHAIYGKYGFCVEHSIKGNNRQLRHLMEWGDRFYDLAQGSLAATPGKIMHLWHGKWADRKYLERTHETTELGYDPYLDVVARPGQPFSWHPKIQKPGLVGYFNQYFASRKEDG